MGGKLGSEPARRTEGLEGREQSSGIDLLGRLVLHLSGQSNCDDRFGKKLELHLVLPTYIT